MNDGSQEFRCLGRCRRRGRPIAARPRAERVTIRLTLDECRVVRANAGSMSLATYARNTLLNGGSLWAEEEIAARFWDTIDQLTNCVIRLDETLQDREESVAEDTALVAMMARVEQTLDQMRVLQVKLLGRVS